MDCRFDGWPKEAWIDGFGGCHLPPPIPPIYGRPPIPTPPIIPPPIFDGGCVGGGQRLGMVRPPTMDPRYGLIGLGSDGSRWMAMAGWDGYPSPTGTYGRIRDGLAVPASWVSTSMLASYFTPHPSPPPIPFHSIPFPPHGMLDGMDTQWDGWCLAW